MGDNRKNIPSRRAVLKSTGAALVGTALYPATVSAATGDKSSCDGCTNIRILNDTEESRTFITKRGGEIYQFTVDKETGRTTGGEIAGATDIDQLNPRTITIQEQDEVFRKIQGKVETRGNCNGLLANKHYGVTIATIKGKNFDNWGSNTVIGALCGAAGAVVGGAAGAALAVVICESFKQIFIGNVDLAGHKNSFGAWDTHTGIAGTEEVVAGGVNKYTLNWRDLHRAKSIPGHLGMGNGIDPTQ